MMNRLCCMRLNTAGVFIGWIGAAMSLVAIIIFSVGLGRLDDLTKSIYDQMNNTDITEDTVRKVLIVILTVYLTVNLINLIASALLVAGTIKERHLMLVPWLINSGLSLCISALYFIYFAVIAISASAPFGSALLTLITAGISLAIQYIIWYAIYSLFKKIQADREQQQQLIHPTGSSYPSYTKI